MNGHVAALQALLSATFRFECRPDLAIEFIVDAGFAGHLTLPPSAFEALQLPFLWHSGARLADNSMVEVSVHAATILWDGEERRVEALATGARPLLGTLLLDGHELIVRFTEGGDVSLAPL
jgi:clan AA aspartic protease